MPKNKEIEILLTLKDEASKKIKSFRSSVKEFNKETKDALQPLLLLRQTWVKTSLALGFGIGIISKGIGEVEKLRKEIESLDIAAIKLGITSKELSVRMYGFDMTTTNIRLGAAEAHAIIQNTRNFWGKFRDFFAGGWGTIAKEWRARMLEGATMKTESGFLVGEPTISRSQARKMAEEQKFAEEEVRKQREAWEKINPEIYNKTKILELSGFEYKKELLKEEIAIYKQNGADKVYLAKYNLEVTKRLEEDRTIALTQQQAARLKAEGRTLDALKIEQQNALKVFNRQFGGDGEMVREFIRGQEAIYRQAQLNFLGLKNEFQIFHDGFVSLVGSMTTTFSDVFYNTITGQIKNLKEVFNSFGQAVLKNLSDMLAQYIMMKAIMGIGSIGSFFSMGTNVLTSGSYNIGSQNLAATAHIGGMGGTYVGMAEGGAGIVKRPTLFLAGEDGPERYQFTPVNRMNQDNNIGKETHIHIHNNQAISFKFWDMADVYAHKGEIIAIFNESTRLQGDVIKSLKKYL